MARTFKGKLYTWQIGDQPIGSGDAGEVFAVTCQEDPSLEGVMKKPAHIATGGTIQRQAGQIAQESLALTRLNGLPKCKAHPPKLLDVSPEFTKGTANFFMVSEPALGQNMAEMLTEFRQSGKPFPHRIIITVLDALFDLFARAHKAGVLWNDVKLDHIYWHNPSGQVAVIDWGNAQFLEGDSTQSRRALPRWEDYQQLVETLGTFLKGTAPELYADLGWEDFERKQLNLPLVSILARRIAYQQELVGLRVMEYQALIRVELSEEPDLARLEKIVSYQHRLNQIGAPWDSEAFLAYSQSLILSSIANNDRQSAIRATSIVWDHFDENLDLAWHLLREYFRNLDIISHHSLYDLVTATIHQNWSQALWTLAKIAQGNILPEWWERLMSVLRQKALGAVSRQPYDIGHSLLDYLQSQEFVTREEINEITRILQNWRDKGKQDQENPFDYALFNILQRDLNLPRQMFLEAKSSFAVGQSAVREVIKAWNKKDWDALQKAFRQVISWDPDRWGIFSLFENVQSFEFFVERLYEGPEHGKEPSVFLEQIITEKPDIGQFLGRPPWLSSLDFMLTGLKQGQPVSNFLADVKLWCPWMLPFETIYSPVLKSTKDEEIIHETLSHFSTHLRNWSDLDAALEYVRTNAPQYHPACKNIIKNFHAIGNLNIDFSEIAENCQKPLHENLKETCEVILTLTNWRGALDKKDYPQALQILDQSKNQNWRIINHAKKVTDLWISETQLLLMAVISGKGAHELTTEDDQTQYLSEIVNQFEDMKETWQKVYAGGINNQLLENLSRIADSNRTGFLEWRRYYEHTKDRLSSLLYYYDLEMIRQISDNFLRLSQHCRQAQHAFSELGSLEGVSLSGVAQISDRLLNHLAEAEKILITIEEKRCFPEWTAAIQAINQAQTISEMRDLVLNMSSNHPLYAWLVQSLLAR